MNTQSKDTDDESETKDIAMSASDWTAMELFEIILKEDVETTQGRYDYFCALMGIIDKKNKHINQDNEVSPRN